MNPNVMLDVPPLPASGTSAGDSIGIQLDHANTQADRDAILTVQAPFTIIIDEFIKHEGLKCVHGFEFHTDQGATEKTITLTHVTEFSTQLAETFTKTIGGSLKSTLNSSLGIPDVASVGSSIEAELNVASETSAAVTRSVRESLEQSVSSKVTLNVLYHARKCYELENKVGIKFEGKIEGFLVLRQNAEKIGNHWHTQNSVRVDIPPTITHSEARAFWTIEEGIEISLRESRCAELTRKIIPVGRDNKRKEQQSSVTIPRLNKRKDTREDKKK